MKKILVTVTVTAFLLAAFLSQKAVAEEKNSKGSSLAMCKVI